MHPLQSPVLKCLEARGFFHQCTDLTALDTLMAKQSITAYIGFDLTADSLHVGSLVPIMLLKWLQTYGHKPLVVLGGGTTKIGDPSGKDEARKMLTPEAIIHNKQAISRIIQRYLKVDDSDNSAAFIDNAQWLDELSYVSLLRDIGPHFSINKMLSFDSVKLRLEREQNLSFLEFNYMILQAYDFVELNKRYQCRLQLGGSDQWGNIVSGIDLGRRLLKQSLYGYTSPLLTTASGAKMGKTASGAVWLDANKLSPYDFWQYWRNVDDADVIRFLKLFTQLPLETIQDYSQLTGSDLNQAKIVLANEVTTLAHGQAQAKQAEETALSTFKAQGLGQALPTFKLEQTHVEQGAGLLSIIVALGFAPSNSAARRLVESGAVKLDQETIHDPKKQILIGDFTGTNPIKLSIGKKKIGVIQSSYVK